MLDSRKPSQGTSAHGAIALLTESNRHLGIELLALIILSKLIELSEPNFLDTYNAPICAYY